MKSASEANTSGLKHSAGQLQASSNSRRRLYTTLLLCLPLAVSFFIHIGYPAFPGDDALMTFRAAKNLLDGKGFVCNPGEYILSTSTPLWAWTVAAASWAAASEPVNVYLPLAIFFNLLNIALIFLLASAGGKRPALGAAAALFFGLSWHANYSAMIGMETPLFVFLLLSTAVAYQLCRSPRARFALGVLAGLSFVARPEGMLLIFALLVIKTIRLRKLPLMEAAGTAAVLLIYWSWMLYYFGSIVPVAALAKKLAYYRLPLQAIKSLLGHVVMLFLTAWYYPGNITALTLKALLLLSICACGVRAAAAEVPGLLLLGVFALAFWLLYGVTNPHMFEWYVVALEPFYCIAFVWGGMWLISMFAGRWQKLAVYSLSISLIALAALRYEMPELRLPIGIGYSGFGHWPGILGEGRKEQPYRLTALAPAERETLYRKLALKFKSELKPGTRVLAPEFGTFGYYSEAKMISSIGHVNPEVFPYLPVPREEIGRHINNGISESMVRGLEPDFILSLETFLRGSVLRSTWVKENYEIAALCSSRVFGSRGLFLLRKRGIQGQPNTEPYDCR